MLIFKIAPVLFLVAITAADKKIELQDIENDNLKSEKQTDLAKPNPRPDTRNEINAADFIKTNLFRYFENQQPQQPRYVQQYAVTEPPERQAEELNKANYGSSPQQAMVSYLSNVPMQIYLVPQYYNEAPEASQPIAYATTGVPRVYPAAPEQSNYIEVPGYITSGKGFIHHYSQPITYLTYAQSTVAPAPTTVASPYITYQMPIVQYPSAIAAPPVQKEYYQSQTFTDTNTVDEAQEEEPKYAAQTEAPYSKPSAPEYPRYYNSRTPLRDEYKHSSVPELPPPNPLLLKGTPPHLSHLPKALPMFRPLTKPVYAAGSGLISSAYSPRPTESYGLPYKRRPTSLLDSYIPSSVQYEYLKRGYAKDPIAVFEALSAGRHYSHPVPRHYERGFLPNQMYHTAAGGITYGHYKRTPKIEKSTKK